MSSSYAESVEIDESDALSIAQRARSGAGEVRGWVTAAAPATGAVTEVSAGFSGFRLGAVCTTLAGQTATANTALADTMQQIGDTTVLCVDAFHSTDNATKLGIEHASTWETEK